MRTILYIEDNFHNRRLVRKILRSRGYKVIEAEDGYTGWQMVQELQPPLVLMDISIPGIDGMEVTRRIKEDPTLRHIPVIAITAAAMRGGGADSVQIRTWPRKDLFSITIEADTYCPNDMPQS